MGYCTILLLVRVPLEALTSAPCGTLYLVFEPLSQMACMTTMSTVHTEIRCSCKHKHHILELVFIHYDLINMCRAEQLTDLPLMICLGHECDFYSVRFIYIVFMVTKSDRWVSSGHSGFLPHEDHPNANIGAMINISCRTCHNRSLNITQFFFLHFTPLYTT